MVTEEEKTKIKTMWLRYMIHNYAMLDTADGADKLKGSKTYLNLMMMKVSYDYLSALRAFPAHIRGDHLYDDFDGILDVEELEDFALFYSYKDLLITTVEDFLFSDDIFDEHLKAITSVMYDVAGCGYLYAQNERVDIEKDIIELAKNSKHGYDLL